MDRGVGGAPPPSESNGWGWGGSGALAWRRAGSPLSLYASLRVSVTCTDLFWSVLMYTCIFIVINNLLPDNSQHCDSVNWEVVDASPTPSDLFTYKRMMMNMTCTAFIFLCNMFYYLCFDGAIHFMVGWWVVGAPPF